MRTAGVTAALLSVVCLLAPAAQFRSGVQTVSVYATVRDATGRLATNLTRDEFRVLDNGLPVDVRVFSSDIQPLTVAVMLDMSGSMMLRFMRVRTAPLHFIEALLPHDRAAIGSFGAEVFVSPMLTGDKSVLRRVVTEELWPGGGTPLWAALTEAMTALGTERGRRVVLALTDGRDSGGISRPAVRRGERSALVKWPGNPTVRTVRTRAGGASRPHRAGAARVHRRADRLLREHAFVSGEDDATANYSRPSVRTNSTRTHRRTGTGLP